MESIREVTGGLLRELLEEKIVEEMLEDEGERMFKEREVGTGRSRGRVQKEECEGGKYENLSFRGLCPPQSRVKIHSNDELVLS